MGKIGRVVCTTVVGLAMIIDGCTSKETSKPEIKPPTEVVRTYDNTINLVKRVVSLVKKEFPQNYNGKGGVIYIGESKEGEHRYIVIEVSEKNGIESLIISSYIGLDSELESVIHGHIANRDYESAKDALNNSNLSIIGFYDYGCDGLSPYTDDFLAVRNIGGQTTTLKDNELSDLLVTAKNAYKLFLEKTESALATKKEIQINKSSNLIDYPTNMTNCRMV